MLFRSQKSGKWGFIDKTGKVIIEHKYNEIGDFSDGLVRVKLNGRWRYVDKNDTLVLTVPYNNVGDFSEGLAKFIDGRNKSGFIDKLGQVIIQPIFDSNSSSMNLSFNNGIAPIQKNGQWGYIDKTGTMIIEPQFSEAGSFLNKFAKVKKGNDAFFINSKGELIVDWSKL